MKEMADPKLARLLREYSDDLKAASPPADLEARLMAAFEQRPPVKRPRHSMGWAIGAAAAAAAAVVIASLSWWASPKQAPIVEVARTKAVAPVQAPAPVAVAAEAPKPAVAVASAARPARRSTLRNSPRVPRELVSEFVPLAENEFLPAPRQAQVLRVSVPRATLASLGFPVMEEAGQGDRVTADVLMGEDGMARAVRFVKTVY